MLEILTAKPGYQRPAHLRVTLTVRRFVRRKKKPMAYATPRQIAETLLREFTRDRAITYAEKIASMTGPLSADYAQAAEILWDGDPDFQMLKTRLTPVAADLGMDPLPQNESVVK